MCRDLPANFRPNRSFESAEISILALGKKKHHDFSSYLCPILEDTMKHTRLVLVEELQNDTNQKSELTF